MNRFIAIIIVSIVVSGCQLFQKDKPSVEVVSPTPTVATEPSPSPIPSPDSEEVTFAKEMIALLAEDPNVAAGEVSLVVYNSSQTHAYGIFDHNYESVAQNAWWYAVLNQVTNDWEIVYWGEAPIECSVLTEYEFPLDYRSDCR